MMRKHAAPGTNASPQKPAKQCRAPSCLETDGPPHRSANNRHAARNTGMPVRIAARNASSGEVVGVEQHAHERDSNPAHDRDDR